MAYQVRSAARCIEVLEHFRRAPTPARAKDIGLALGFSPSTTNDLLKTMVEIGYLSFDERFKLYSVGLRAGMFANWLTQAYPQFGDLHELAQELRGASGECVVISAQRGHLVEFISILPGPDPVPSNISEGLSAPMIGTAAGGAIMMCKDTKELMQIVRRTYRLKTCDALFQALLRSLGGFQRNGYASLTKPDFMPGFWSLAIPLPADRFHFPLALGVGGPDARIKHRERELMDLLRDRVGRCTAPHRRSYGTASATI